MAWQWDLDELFDRCWPRDHGAAFDIYGLRVLGDGWVRHKTVGAGLLAMAVVV
ncbi:MAG: hypothetical protein ACRESJ_11180 [Pseudomonas sp.]|uniref:hypothetical protein n=1 Tax=Pseudomonas sp. TaxID=306 RepID=UPI003D6E1DBB